MSELLSLYEIDDEGLVVRAVAFDLVDVEAAYDELERRYAAGEGRPYGSILSLMRRTEAAHLARDWPAFSALHHSDLVTIDHGPASAGALHGIDAFVRYLRGHIEVVPDIRLTTTQIVRTSANAMLRRRRVGSRETETEMDFIELDAHRDGRWSYIECLPPERIAEAIARFDELLGPRPDAARLENAATRLIELSRRILDEADWDAADRFIADDVELDDRRHGVRSVGRGRDAWIANFKAVHDLGFRSGEGRDIAIRGDRLSLNDGWMVDADGNQLAALQLNELDGSGRVCRFVWFDPEDRDAAFGELERRYLETDPPHADVWRACVEMRQAHDARDWERFRSIVAPDVVLVDRRPASLGRVEGRDGCVAALSAIADVITDVRARVPEIVAISANALMCVSNISGMNAEGGPVELPRHFFVGRVEDCVFRHIELIPLNQRDNALERFTELSRTTGVKAARSGDAALTNSATSVADRIVEAVAQGDVDAFLATHRSDVTVIDERSGLRNVITGREAAADNFRAFMQDVRVEPRRDVLAIRGDRLALVHLTFTLADSGFVLDFVALGEVDADGLAVRMELFDTTDLDNAFQRLDEWYIEGEGAPYARAIRSQMSLQKGWNTRDWELMASAFAEELDFVDHRPAALGELRGRDEIIRWASAGITADVRHDIVAFHAIEANGAVVEVLSRGTNAEGGIVEQSYLHVFVLDREGRTKHTERFDVDDLDRALARFDESGAGDPSTGLGAELANTATRNANLAREARHTGDWDSIRSLFTDDVVIEDRRAGLGTRGAGLDAMIRNFEVVRDLGFRPAGSDVEAIRGDRLALVRGSSVDPAGNEIEVLALIRADAHDRIDLVIYFDLDAADAAFDEIDELFVAGEGAPYADMLRGGDEQRIALRNGDWATYRALTDPEIVLVDHRPASLGEIHGVDAVLNVLQTLAPLMRGMKPRVVAYPALADDRTLTELVATGTAEHGGEVEMAHLRLQQYRDGRVVRAELFPVDALDDALARFDELGAGVPTTLDPWGRFAELYRRQDWDAIEKLHAPGYLREDHRHGVRLVGGTDQFMDSVREMWNIGFKDLTSTIIATRGDRLMLRAGTYSDAKGNVLEFLTIVELNEDGLRTWSANFDADDLDAAFEELDERYIAGEGAPFADLLRATADSSRARLERDWARMRSYIADDVEVVDHRTVGLGVLRGADAWIEFLRAAVDLIPDERVRGIAIHAIAPHGMVRQVLRTGTNLDGGHVEMGFQNVVIRREGVVIRIENFPLERLDDALARFEELREHAH